MPSSLLQRLLPGKTKREHQNTPARETKASETSAQSSTAVPTPSPRSDERSEINAAHEQAPPASQKNEQQEGLETTYGDLTEDAKDLRRVALDSLSADSIGSVVAVRARLSAHRDVSASLTFLILKLRTTTVQAVLSFKAETDGDGAEISHGMMTFAQHIPRESIVLVVGEVTTPKSADGRVHAVSAHNFEIAVKKLFVISEAHLRPYELPMPTVDTDAGGKHGSDERKHPAVELSTRLAHRAFDLRVPVNQSIFRVQAKLCSFFRRYLEDQGFLEIHSAKLQASASESGASVFKVDYFGRKACLAQSPQLAKQMCMSGDFERVMEIGPVFRAEPSNTVRHLTEYTGLDLEMTIEHDYSELRSLVDELLRTILRGLLDSCHTDIELIRSVYPSEDFLLPETTPILDFEQGCRLLKDAGVDQDPYEDLSTANEKVLGAIVRDNYKSDYYILDRFPTAARPFYTMRDPDDPRRSRSFDIFWRGQEIISGGQRVHDAHQLIENLVEAGIQPDSMRDYVDGFRCGAPPHGGMGLGLERATMLFLALPNIRLCSLFPRDPASLRTQELPPLIKPIEVKTERSVFGIIEDPKRAIGVDDGHRIERSTAQESRFGVRED